MKINFTKQEYIALLEMLEAAEWLMHSRNEKIEKTPHTEIKKKLFSYYKEMGAEDYIVYSKELDDYFATQAVEVKMHDEYIDPYDNHLFWQTLSDELAKRDLRTQMDSKERIDLAKEEQMKKFTALVEWYEGEFTQHGLSRVSITGNLNISVH